jgi:hypothetical protein
MAFGMFTAKQVEGFERIIKKYTSQGAADFSQAHRDPSGGRETMTQERWDKMSFTEKQQFQMAANSRRAG